VIAVDVKPQIQALQVTQRPLPAIRGCPETRTHDYLRCCTTCLFAALDTQTGHVWIRNTKRQRSREFLAFLDQIEPYLKPGQKVYVILDNASQNKSRMTRKWLEEHPNWEFHFIPISASWMNPAEGFFSKVSRGVLKNRPFGSIEEIRGAIPLCS